MSRVSEKTMERVARAMYAANGFVLDWDHPKRNPAWTEIYMRQARIAIKEYRKSIPEQGQ